MSLPSKSGSPQTPNQRQYLDVTFVQNRRYASFDHRVWLTSMGMENVRLYNENITCRESNNVWIEDTPIVSKVIGSIPATQERERMYLLEVRGLSLLVVESFPSIFYDRAKREVNAVDMARGRPEGPEEITALLLIPAMATHVRIGRAPDKLMNLEEPAFTLNQHVAEACTVLEFKIAEEAVTEREAKVLLTMTSALRRGADEPILWETLPKAPEDNEQGSFRRESSALCQFTKAMHKLIHEADRVGYTDAERDQCKEELIKSLIARAETIVARNLDSTVYGIKEAEKI